MKLTAMKVYHVKGPSPQGEADIQIPRSEITGMKSLIMADGKSGYSEMLRVLSHPAAIGRVRMVAGTHTLQWVLNSSIILGRLGAICIVILLLLQHWWWALGCVVLEYIVVCVVQTQINYEIAARLFVLDAALDREFKNAIENPSSKAKGVPDMTKILASLNSTVELTNNLRKGSPDCEQLNNVLTSHVSTLEMLLQRCMETARSTASTKAEGKVLTQIMQDLFGKDSAVANHMEKLSESCPNISEKHLSTFQKIAEQVGELNRLQHELREGGGIDHVVNRQFEIIRELPAIFPEGVPIRNSLEKRIRLLR